MNYALFKHKLRYGSICNIGGDSSAAQSTATTNNTTNNLQNLDRRIVGSDQAIGVSGDGNSIVKNQNTAFTSNTDSGVHYSNSSTNLNSNNVTTTTTNNLQTTDYGSVQSALASATKNASAVIGFSGDAIQQAFDSVTAQNKNNNAILGNIIDLTGKSSANSQGTAMQALGLVSTSQSAVNDALQTVKSGALTSKVIIYGLIAAAVVGVAYSMKKG